MAFKKRDGSEIHSDGEDGYGFFRKRRMDHILPPQGNEQQLTVVVGKVEGIEIDSEQNSHATEDFDAWRGSQIDWEELNLTFGVKEESEQILSENEMDTSIFVGEERKLNEVTKAQDDVTWFETSLLPSSKQKSLYDDPSSNSSKEGDANHGPKDSVNTSPATSSDPNSARNEIRHEDAQRTIKILDDISERMPICGDNGENEIEPPPGLVQLYQHQNYALRWMTWREGQFPGGGILADEMGLGKTIEIIALIMKSKWDAMRNGGGNKVSGKVAGGNCVPPGTTLVVCPLGIIPQWIREIETKGTELHVFTYHGAAKKKISASELAQYDIVITTYATIAREIRQEVVKDADKSTTQSSEDTPKVMEKGSSSTLKQIKWLRIVLDEAHIIRNPKTKAAKALYQLEACHRWAVSGTPIHNTPQDFYSLCKYLRVEPFNERLTWNALIGLKKIRLDAARQRINVLSKALILRRTKDKVSLYNDPMVRPIPPKKGEIVEVELSDDERAVYKELKVYVKRLFENYLRKKEERKQSQEFGGIFYAADPNQEKCRKNITYWHILAKLVRLRQFVIHPYILTTRINMADELGVDYDLEELEELELKLEHLVTKSYPLFDKHYVSSKFQKILNEVDELRTKAETTGKPMEKVIIASSWTSVLDLICDHLVAKHYFCVFITGREDMDKRMEIMDQFNSDTGNSNILLLSLMAGEAGLNLTGANYVFFAEPHWNPQHEIQAQDRVHRFGQTKHVFIRRFIVKDSIEDRIVKLQELKKTLADGVLNGAGITSEQMEILLEFRTP